MVVRQAVIPAAGLGTRFLPLTKAVPKEMVPILDKPAIHYIISEAIDSGVEEICIVCSPDRETTMHYLQPDDALAAMLERKGKASWMAEVDRLIDSAQYTFVFQEQPRGLGDAILCARSCLTDDYFAILLPDDMLLGDTPGLKQLVRVATQYDAGVVALMPVTEDEVSAYGIIEVAEEQPDGTVVMTDVIEKPAKEDAPSNLAIIGRYIFPRQLLVALERVEPAVNGEVQLTDAIVDLIRDDQRVLGYKLDLPRFDAGTPAGWLQANIHMALRDPRYAAAVRDAI